MLRRCLLLIVLVCGCSAEVTEMDSNEESVVDLEQALSAEDFPLEIPPALDNEPQSDVPAQQCDPALLADDLYRYTSPSGLAPQCACPTCFQVLEMNSGVLKMSLDETNPACAKVSKLMLWIDGKPRPLGTSSLYPKKKYVESVGRIPAKITSARVSYLATSSKNTVVAGQQVIYP